MRDAVKTRGLIVVTLLSCFFIILLPNFDVLPDRRYLWAQNQATERKPQKFVCVLPSEPESLAAEEFETSTMEVPNFKNDSVFRAPISYAFGQNNTLRISSSSSGANYVCKHQQIHDIDAGNRFVETDWSENFTGTLDLENLSQHVHLYCTDSSGGILADYFLEVLPKGKVEHVKKVKIPSKHSTSQTLSRDGFSALLISVSGLSRRDFASTMRRTWAFLKADPRTVDMKFHSQNGFSRLLSLFTLLAGKPTKEPKLTSYRSRQPEFSGDLIWKAFEEKGYITVSTEDDPEKGTLNFDSKHFRHIDFSPVALVQAHNHAKATYPNVDPRLSAQSPGENFHLDYVDRLLRSLRGMPMFVYLGLSNVSADPVVTGEASLDDQLAIFMRKLKIEGLLRDTLLFVMSDFAQILPGRQQPHALPLYVSLPKRFVRRYPTLYASLKNNSASVTTHLDVHATLLELVSSSDAMLQVHGQSLFRLISVQRPCETILVPKSLCPCQSEPLPQS